MRSKEKFIEETGGFRFGESLEQFQRRAGEIQVLTEKLKAGKLTEAERQRLYKLKGLPPDEFDYAESN